MNKVIFVFKKKKIIIIIKEQSTKQNGKQPIFQSSPPPTPSPAPPPSRILTYTYLHILHSCLALAVTKTLRLTEKLLLRSKEGSFLYCSLTTVLQTAQNADLLLCFIDVHAVFQNATQQLY